jgi:hypothetical protein
MEFVQFFPLALAEPGYPPRLIGAGIVEESHIINKYGENIPDKYGVTDRLWCSSHVDLYPLP